MEQIKSVTLHSVDYLSEVLFTKTKKSSKNEIQYKLIDYISKNGKNKFIELYNNTFKFKNFEETFEIIKI